VRFLVDNQLPHALARLLTDLGHQAVHVLDIGLAQENDRAIWAYAAQNGFVIASKDADFADLAILDPHPVQIVWVRVRNCRKATLLESFKNALDTIERELNAGENLIELY
jgi:predicted nuclease of predicted toxin-antitoxin system